MKRLPVHLFSCVVAAVLLPLLLTTAVAQAQAAPWTVVKSPNPGAGNGLFGAASISANDVWAVGEFTTASGVMQPLTLHWNGKKWSIVKIPTASSGNNSLRAVAAVSTSDVWAVGEFTTASGSGQALIEHWNGKNWSVVASPPAGTGNVLLGVAAVSATDVWAVAAVSSSDVWAVGDSGSGTLIEQWNGSTWSVVTHPTDPSTITNDLNGVAIVSTNDIWAVGDFIDNTTGAFQTLIEQWNGTSWSIVSSPNPSGMQDFFDAASADPSSGQAWAVGSFIAFNP